MTAGRATCFSEVSGRAAAAWLLGVVLWAAVFASGAAAQPAPASEVSALEAPLPIGRVLSDADADFAPDRLGERVTVAGRALVASGALRARQLDVFIRDTTGALRLVAPAIDAPIAEGDSVIATGTLEHFGGLPQLTDLTYRVVPSERHVFDPFPVTTSPSFLEQHEGQLGTIEGMVAGLGEVREGRYLNVVSDGRSVVVFVYAAAGEGLSLDGVSVGSHVRVTGIIGQYDFVEPLSDSYQLYPRYAHDVEVGGFSPSFYRNLLLGSLALLLAAFGWAYLLRRQVRSRVRALRRSEARYEALFDHTGDAIFVYPLEGDAAGTFSEVNPVACDALGTPRAALRRFALADVVASEAAGTLENHLRALRTRHRAVHELPLRIGRGAPVPFEFSSRLFDLDGTPTALSLARNIAERKRYERDLITAKQEAERLTQLKSSFLANMSHEIRTPLTGIIGFADLLADEAEEPHREFAATISESSRRLLGTINSVLNLSKLDARQMQLAPERIDVAREVREALRLLRPMAERKGLAFRTDLPGGALRTVHDAGCLHRIINNLVGNAIKFTADGHVRVALDSRGDTLCLVVEDTGIGMSEDFLPSLFDEFRQETDEQSRAQRSRAEAEAHAGSGLGLSITKRLVELMDGRIAVESEKGEGTTFTVTLPRSLHAGDGRPGDLPPAQQQVERVDAARYDADDRKDDVDDERRADALLQEHRNRRQKDGKQNLNDAAHGG